jgi:glycosyltransferase involved in cell wall biosynthesis
MAGGMNGVTVIVPVYNVKCYLNNALESYLNQSLKNKEIILIDDGSTDGSGLICDEYASKYENVSVFHINNGGASAARNYAIEKAAYDYLVFLDADDYIEKNALEEMYSRMIMDESDQVICGYFMETVTNCKTKCIKYSHPRNEVLMSFEDFNKIEFWDNSLIYNVWNKLYKKKIIMDCQIYFRNMRMGEDLEFNMRYMEYCDKISILNQCFYHYVRGRAGAVTGSYIKNWFEIRNEEHKRMLEFFDKHNINNDEIIEFVNRRYIERVLGCIVNEFHKKNPSTFRSRRNFLKSVIENDMVQKSLKLMRPKSKKVAIMIIPLKRKWIMPTYVMGAGIARIRSILPQLYMRLKAAR